MAETTDNQASPVSSRENSTDNSQEINGLSVDIKAISQGHITSSKFYRLTNKCHKMVIAECSTHGYEGALHFVIQLKDHFMSQKLLAAGLALWSNGLTTIINDVSASNKRNDELTWERVGQNLDLLEIQLKNCEFEGKHIVQGDMCKLRSLQCQIAENKLHLAKEYSLKGAEVISQCESSSWCAGIMARYLNFLWQNIDTQTLRSVLSPSELFEELESKYEMCYHYLLLNRESDNFAHLESLMALRFSLELKLKLPFEINSQTLKLYLNKYRVSAEQLEKAEDLLVSSKVKFTHYLSGIDFHQYKVMGLRLSLYEVLLKIRKVQNLTSPKSHEEAYELLLDAGCTLEQMPRDVVIGRYPIGILDDIETYINCMQDQLRVLLHSKRPLQTERLMCLSTFSEASDSIQLSSCPESVESDLNV